MSTSLTGIYIGYRGVISTINVLNKCANNGINDKEHMFMIELHWCKEIHEKGEETHVLFDSILDNVDIGQNTCLYIYSTGHSI